MILTRKLLFFALNFSVINFHMFAMVKHDDLRLIEVVSAQNIKEVSDMLTTGANPNVIDDSGKCPLIAAVLVPCCKNVSMSQIKSMVELLLKNGANPNTIINCDGWYCPILTIAAMNGWDELVTILLKFKADINLCTNCRGPVFDEIAELYRLSHFKSTAEILIKHCRDNKIAPKICNSKTIERLIKGGVLLDGLTFDFKKD